MLDFSWQHFYTNFKADVRLWIYFILLQLICQSAFIYSIANYFSSNTHALMITQALAHGIRYDSLWATVWLFIPLSLITLPSIKFNICCSKNRFALKFRYYLGAAFTTITILLYIISIEYFREYKDLFNQFLFNFFYDDQKAIFKTIWAEHHVLYYLTVLIFSLILYCKYISKVVIVTQQSCNFLNNSWAIYGTNTASKPNINQSLHYSLWQKTLITAGIIALYIIGFRGSIGDRPIQLKDAGVTPDAILNKTVISPYSALKYAIKEYRIMQNQEHSQFATSKPQLIQKIAKDFFHNNAKYKKLSSYMHKIAQGSHLTTPEHIFLIIGESLDAWPLQEKYKMLQLTTNLQRLSNQGLHLKYFLPCSDGTMETINTILTGLPDGNLHINYQPSSYQTYPTALAKQFNNMGYKTQFFYGGYLSWQRLEDFAYAQGFTAVYGAPHISNWQQTNEWGVDDRSLFNFIAKKLRTTHEPTFNVIMTTSNHPPFSVNLAKEGFNEKQMAKLLTDFPNTPINVKELGHIWYADKAIGEFITKITKQYPNALFAITGDHFGRRHILYNPPLFDTSAVPLILYTKNIQQYYKFSKLTAGSHLDLSATLIELVASKGFSYYAMGDNLLSTKMHTFGIGKHKVITHDYIASTEASNICMYLHPNKFSNIETNELEYFKLRHNQAMNIAWWMIKKGDSYGKGD